MKQIFEGWTAGEIASATLALFGVGVLCFIAVLAAAIYGGPAQ